MTHITAVITGASGGIGRAIALRLAADGAQLCLIGRSPGKLEALRAALAPSQTTIHTLCCDLDKEDDLRELPSAVAQVFPRLDVLIHAAGAIATAPLASVAPADLDRQYRVNVRAPVLITQSLLAPLQAARGQIVFINSSLGLRTKERAGAYAATKHALKAIADTLRMEVNASGVRVLSVFPGNTATGMQEQVCREFGAPYDPASMLRPDDVAAAVVNALMLPRSAELTDLHIRPMRKQS